jgi:hypothetical protein
LFESAGSLRLEVFRTECIRDCAGDSDYRDVVDPRPYYERHGEQQAAARVYEHIIRYTEHMLPISSYLQEHQSVAALQKNVFRSQSARADG